jgi:hypothetical protein
MKNAALLVLALLLALAMLGGGWKWGGHSPKSGQGVWQEAGWAWDPGDGGRAMNLR